ncbi:hypothetical protein [Nonomuraea sp. 10N515B]|uniref:hypothetical protein n=1 Tax=Nonomuraea sp. 10N515B TaxID=3457422 RepID=UPI003FCE73D7
MINQYSPDDSDGRFPEDTLVLVRHPLRDDQNDDRDSWPWLPSTVLAQCSPDEWRIIVEVPALAIPDPSVTNGDARLRTCCTPFASATPPRFTPSACTYGNVYGTRQSTTNLG